nr:hypothetical protein [Tanacetum cinerariifolium]
MEPRPEPNREATPTLWPRSPVVRRQRERVVGFKEATNREESGRGRNVEGIRPSEIQAREDENRGVNLPPLFAAHLGRNKSGTPMILFDLHTWRPPTLTNMERISLLTDKKLSRASLHRPHIHLQGFDGKTYTWIEAKEVATNETPNNQRENFERSRKSSWDNNQGQKRRDRFSSYQGPNHRLISNLSKSPREIHAIDKAARSSEQAPRMFGSRRSRDMSKYCHFHEDHGHETNYCRQLRNQIEEAVKSG